MDINEVHTEWARDAKVNKDELADESLKIPLLHAKYMRFLSDTRVLYKKSIEKRKILESTLEDYYGGVIDGKDIGRPPWQIEERKGNIEKRVHSDKDMVRANIKIAEYEETVLLLKEIVNNLNQRNFQLKVALDFIKWTNGG